MPMLNARGIIAGVTNAAICSGTPLFFKLIPWTLSDRLSSRLSHLPTHKPHNPNEPDVALLARSLNSPSTLQEDPFL